MNKCKCGIFSSLASFAEISDEKRHTAEFCGSMGELKAERDRLRAALQELVDEETADLWIRLWAKETLAP